MSGPRWFPSSHGQAALWFLWKLAPESWAHNIVLPARVLGDLDPAALQRALQALSERHGCLRIAFDDDGELRQRELADHPVLLDRIDARGWSQAELDAAVLACARRPFDLAASAALTTTLFERSRDEHVLVFSIHHIVSDLWSFIIMMDELRELYRAEVSGGPRLREPSIRYERFVAEERRLVEGDEGTRQLGYWREVLAGEHPALDLPADRPRPPLQTFRGATVRRVIDAELTRQLKLLAAHAGCTLFMALVAAYQVLLHRYTGQDEIIVGTPTSGRHRPEFNDLVGYLVNMVALRGDLSGAPSFRHLLRQTRERVLGAIAHQDYPFSVLVDQLQLPRDLSRSPLFQTSFVLRQRFHRFEELGRFVLPAGDELPIPFGLLELVPLPVPQQEGQFDLSLEMKEDERGRLVGAWKYATDLFDAATIERMAGHFETLLRGLVAEPDRSIAELGLLTEVERREEIARAAGPRAAMPEAQSVVELFEARAREQGERIAVRSGDRAIRYAELLRDVRAAACHLAELGAQPDDLVAVLLPRDISFVTWMLAANRAGAGFLPLNPRHPIQRIKQALTAARTPVVVSSRAAGLGLWDEVCAFASARGIRVVDTDSPLPGHSREPPALPRGRDVAYAMFTSGSTGEPKGVLVEHTGMVNHVLGKLEELGMGPDDVLAQTGPQTFDIVVWQCLAPLIQGGTVAVFSDAQAEDAAELVREAQRVGVTVMQLVPSMLHALLEEVTGAEDGPPPLPALRWMVSTGDALPIELCQRWLAAYPDVPLLNSYGSTECSDDQCHYEIRCVRAVDKTKAIAPIGSPIRNMAAYVLDRQLTPVPAGVIGELYLGGIGVGRGYLHDPRRTAESFVPDRLSGPPGARLYRTRDLARRRADGSLEFLGRADGMIKIRGFRIEPGEIEATLVLHPDVSEAAVVAREHPSGERLLVAYVVPRSGEAPDGHALRAFLGSQLPQYMVPHLICAIPALPLTSNGKVDQRALPVADRENAGAREHVPPRTDTETTLAGIWAEVLGFERIGTSDDFFAIGGDSIRSIQIVARCKRTGIELRPADLFLHPTIAALAAYVDRRREPNRPLAVAPELHVSAAHLAQALAQVGFDAD
ncbi:non-ribosomal peptide synthetase [Sorangium sp. So ce385]|uniref:non-ribosomal peptide synthetase n=1 Tax=Sorangium sp. So ce385 TaxID=3133308 RepID=UPI003F5C0078